MPSVQLVVILLVPTTLALAFVFIPRQAESVPLRLVGVWLVLVVVAVTAVGDRASAGWASHQGTVNRVQSVLIVTFCAIFAWLNRRGQPIVLAAVFAVVGGAALNALATLVYGGMPVRRAAGIAAGASAAQMSAPHPINGYVLSDGRGWFAHYAGDFIPVPHGHVVFSIGDVLLWVGLAALLILTFRSVAPQRAEPSRPTAI